MKQSLEMVQIIHKALDEKLAEDIRIIKVDEVTVMADYLIITNGSSTPQVDALIDNVQDRMAEKGYHVRQVEGNRNATWTLLDYGDVIVHVFTKEDRLFYDLERIWKDGSDVKRDELN